jgi:glyoxylase-like metal-dependent hydrolase (beta-lactamase superfamily II)
MEIIPNVHQVPGVIANAYLIVDPDGLTLIDAGLPGSAKKILAFIKNLGRQPSELKRIIITHSDFDHISGLAAVQQASGARICASEAEARSIATGHASRKMHADNFFMKWVFAALQRFGKAKPAHVDEILADGQVLPLLGGLRVLKTAGHTPGHISLYAESAKILFCGDSIISDKEGALLASRKPVTWDRTKANSAVRKQAGLGAQIVCPGHGPVVRDAAGKFPKV